MELNTKSRHAMTEGGIVGTIRGFVIRDCATLALLGGRTTAIRSA